jgi:DeoR/GlpR family transcriptional regulator of sugar metabolism
MLPDLKRMGLDDLALLPQTIPRFKARRKPIAERLYKQGFTMDQIATQLGVTTWTISKDLKEFSPEVKTSRPKGGRPKAVRLTLTFVDQNPHVKRAA